MKSVASLYLFALVTCAVLTSCSTAPVTSSTAKQTSTKTTEIKGSLVPSSQPTKFKTDSGAVYTLVSNRMSSALFIDPTLQAKILLLKGKVLPERRFEVTGNLHSIHGGKVHELFYYCDVCAIKGIDPGPCMCCREPVVLVEDPAK